MKINFHIYQPHPIHVMATVKFSSFIDEDNNKNLENKLSIWMCLVEQTYKGMNALVKAPFLSTKREGLSGLRNQIYPDQKMT
ncbi:hypothetical protein VA7868_04527 [Vibrio aerogenes CECT 7868]|uniref:Uncharacterized protein n=1 Tax=Vibrio aerogenes CECT 7868 TaxID=1216006 RepID=A0A1M6EVF9_9VIBR|nr:hypothetical protein VA7868_04527 [Vibrio aerogenes CECT 7868]